MLADEGGVNCVLRSPQECHAVQCTCCALAVPCVDETSQRFVEEASMAPTDCSSVKTSLPFPSLPFPSLPFPYLPYPSLPFPSLPFPSLRLLCLLFPSPPVPPPSLYLLSLVIPSLPFPSPPFLPVPSSDHQRGASQRSHGEPVTV